MSRYRKNLFFLYLLNISFVGLTYYLEEKYKINKTFDFFNYYILFSTIYFLWAKFTNFTLKSSKHVFILGLMFIGTEPIFENDHYRYLWEGKVIAEGFNPYKTAPNSKKLDSIEFEKRDSIGYSQLTSIYPPLAQMFFIIHSPFSYKIAFCFMQFLGLLMLIYIIFNIFEVRSKSLILLLPYFYKEFVSSVHIDILAIFVMVFLLKKNSIFSAVVVSFTAKILSIVILPLLFIKGLFTDRALLIKTVITSLMVISIVYLYPFKVGGQSGGEAYISDWSWNSLLGLILNKFNIADLSGRVILLSLYSLSYAYIIRHFYKNKFRNINRYFGLSYLFLFLFTPVLHPWYLIWGIVFIRNNQFFAIYIFSSFLAYYNYGSPYLEGYAEAVQFTLLILSIKKQFKSTEYKLPKISI